MPHATPTSPPPLANPNGAALCRGCSAPLAPDQRYCLSCGVRVGEPRIAALELLPGGRPSVAAAPAGAEGPGSLARRLDRLGGPMGLAAIVLVALGVGFLLGQGGTGGGAQTIIQRPPVVNVTGGGAASGTPTSSGTASSSDGSASGGGKHKGKGSSADTSGVPAATPDNTGGDLNKLQAQPKEQATQGAPPKTDNKAAGGGSATETIG